MAVERTLPLIGVGEKLFIEILSVLFILSGIFAFYRLVVQKKQVVPYGRYDEGKHSITIPSWIAWFILPLPSFLIPLYAIFTRGYDAPFVNFSIVLLFTIHYFHRTFIYGLLNKGKPATLQQFFAIFPILVFDGYIQSYYHLLDNVIYPPGYLWKISSVLGISLFSIGLLINAQSDRILRNLRKPGETGYKIPKGGMFEYVSGANFFGEIIEWAGFALYAQTLPSLAAAIVTICNIEPRAWFHHQWYLRKFDNYPKNRKALVPFLL